MHTTPDQRLLEFIRKFRVDLTPEGTITRLELYHSIEGSMGERLATFEMADRDEDEDPDDLAQEIWDEAEGDASLRPTGAVERYVVQAYRGDTREPDEQKAFVVTGKLVTALTGNGSEPPTERGMIMADNRRTNDLHALVVRMCEATAGSAAVQLQREREENQRLREMGFKYEQARQALLDRQQERDIERDEARSSSQMNQMMMTTLLQLAPVILQKLLTPPAPPGATLPLAPAAPPVAVPNEPSAAAASAPPAVPEAVVIRDATIAELLSTVSMDQMKTLLSTFDGPQKQKFLAVYTSFRDHPPAPPSGSPPSPAN